MGELRRWGAADWAGFLTVLVIAAGSRFWYVNVCAEGGYAAPLLEVQGGISSSALPPLADKEESTAHSAPGYPWLLGLLDRGDIAVDAVMRWTQAVLGTLAAVCYFFLARRVFRSLLVGTLAGTLAALHPFWIINTAEMNDGVLATFLLAASLMLGTRAAQAGGAVTSLLFGLALASLAMTRAALLPFAVIAFLWFLLQCRELRAGWFFALLAFLGFGNGLAPWAVRNFREFGEPVPVADSALLHVWMGNNPEATGGPLDETSLRKSLPPERLKALLAEPNQAARYAALGEDICREVTNDPGAFAGRRLWAGLTFVLGENWFTSKTLAKTNFASGATTPEWIGTEGEGALRFSLLILLIGGFLGWRFSFGWRKQARLATLAALWVPLPYLLTHGDLLSGSRLPLDGVWICLTAFAIACCFRGVRRAPG